MTELSLKKEFRVDRSPEQLTTSIAVRVAHKEVAYTTDIMRQEKLVESMALRTMRLD